MYVRRNPVERGGWRHSRHYFVRCHYIEPEERHWQTLRRDSYGNNVAVILLRITRPLPLDQDLDHVSG